MIIALESASSDQSVAVADATGILIGSAAWSADRGQGSDLLPRLVELLDRSGAALADVSGVAVGIGPGSYTGLRVGLALAKGLAAGIGCPIVGVRSLDAWLLAVPRARAAVVRAGASEVYLQARDDGQPRVVAFADVAAEIGTGPVVAPRDLGATLGLGDAEPPDGAAAAVATVGAQRFTAGLVDDLARLEPIYLRPPRGLSDALPGPVTWL